MRRDRLEGLSDNVFAVALTILIFDIKFPGVDITGSGTKHPLDVLAAQWPHYLGYVITFLVVAMIWLQHHWIFRHMEKVDNIVFFLNILLLMLVVFFPLPTGMLASYLGSHTFETDAAAIYGAFLVGTTLVVSVMWLVVARRRRLVAVDLHNIIVRRLTIRILATPVLYLLGFGVSLINVPAGVTCYVLVALVHLVLLRPSLLDQAALAEGGVGAGAG
jgi:uncharacterized membrane protein